MIGSCVCRPADEPLSLGPLAELEWRRASGCLLLVRRWGAELCPVWGGGSGGGSGEGSSDIQPAGRPADQPTTKRCYLALLSSAAAACRPA